MFGLDYLYFKLSKIYIHQFLLSVEVKKSSREGRGRGRPIFVCVASIATCFREINCNVQLNWMWKLALEIKVKIILWTSWNNHCQRIYHRIFLGHTRAPPEVEWKKKNISGQTSWYWFHFYFLVFFFQFRSRAERLNKLPSMDFGTKLNSNELFVIRFHNMKITIAVDEDQTIFKNFIPKALLLDSGEYWLKRVK